MAIKGPALTADLPPSPPRTREEVILFSQWLLDGVIGNLIDHETAKMALMILKFQWHALGTDFEEESEHNLELLLKAIRGR